MRLKPILVTILIFAAFRAVQPILAQEDPAFFVIGGTNYVGGSGWYAGYVITGSGTYELRIWATGSESQYPITDVKLIILISDEAQGGGLSFLAVNGIPISGWTPKKPDYYVPSGGPFSEPDYYGYHEFTLTDMTFNEVHWPDKPGRAVTVNIQFAPGATEASKVAFLCYGIDAKGQTAYTAFSKQTVFTVPELATIAGIVSMFGAFGLYSILKQKRTKG